MGGIGLLVLRRYKRLCLLLFFMSILFFSLSSDLSLRGGKADEVYQSRVSLRGGSETTDEAILRLLPLRFALGFGSHARNDKDEGLAITKIAEKKDLKKEEVSAEVNKTPITQKEVSDLVSVTIPRITGHRSLPEERMRFFRAQALNQLIEAELLYQEAKKGKLKAEKKEIDAELKKIKERYPNEDAFNKDIKKKGLTVKEIRKGLERHILISKIVKIKNEDIDKEVVVKDGDFLPYYEKNKDKFILPEQIRIRQILISVDSGASEQEWKEAEKKGAEIAGRAIKGEDFAKLAKEFSDDIETKDKGGDVGPMHKGQMHLPEIEEIAFSLSESDISQPIRTIYGYLIIKIEEKKPEKRLEFSELNKDLLRSELLTSAKSRLKEAWLNDLRDKATIKVYEK